MHKHITGTPPPAPSLKAIVQTKLYSLFLPARFDARGRRPLLPAGASFDPGWSCSTTRSTSRGSRLSASAISWSVAPSAATRAGGGRGRAAVDRATQVAAEVVNEWVPPSAARLPYCILEDLIDHHRSSKSCSFIRPDHDCSAVSP